MTEVHFCNLCDQSVPQEQLESGAAVRHASRILCEGCRDVLIMSSGGSRPRSRGGTAALLIVGLIGWAAATYVWLELEDLRTDSRLSAETASVQSQTGLFELEARLGQSFSRLDERASVQESALALLRQDQARASEALQVQLGALERSTERIPDLADMVERGEQRIREVEAARTLVGQELSDLRAVMELVRDGMNALEDRVAAVPAPPTASDFPREVEELLAQLRDADPLQRSIALEKLGKLSDPRLIAYVEPLLRDSYEMNRYYAATSLGSWKASASVPALIEALQDEYSLVRKAANDSLLVITGQDQGFDAKAPEAERRKAYERWKSWIAQASGRASAG